MKIYITLIGLLLLVSCGENQTNITLNAENAGGLTTDASITLKGIEIGKVNKIKITSKGVIAVECNLNSNTKIPSDSKFTIENTDLLGTKGIFVEYGKSSEIIKNGDILKLFPIETSFFGDSLGAKIESIIEDFTGLKKQEEILIELRRLNENLEKTIE
ncbi:MlaD family protein [Putridiphycobacter roseus]|nr:MlaD family protein [Putridiphycobacter roseus]